MPGAITFDRVPHPAYDNRIITNSTAWNDLGERTIRAVCWHRMLGSLWGTDGYFRGPAASRALTDYGIGVAQDGAYDGVIFRWNDPRGRRAPWANGPVSQPYGDGKAFVDRYGINSINRDVASIETSGMQETPLTEKSRDAIAGLTAYWADQYEVPWDAFPMVPNEGRSFVVWHEELTYGTGKRCPFMVVKAETDALIARTKAVLKRHQTSQVAEPPAPPAKYAHKHPLPTPPRVQEVNGVLFFPFRDGASIHLTATRDVEPKEWADPTAKATGPFVKQGEKKLIAFMTVGANNELWIVGSDGSRYPAASFSPAT